MDQLELTRSDLLQLDLISNKGTLRLLPIGKKKKQKLVVGDDSGQLHCYEFKKGEPQVVFVVKTFEGPITRVVLGGDQLKSDKIFASHGQQVVGMTKKGKDFFKLTSSLTETIHSLVVEENRIWTGCEFIYNLYDGGKDTAFFMSRDQINDLLVACVTKEHEKDALLGCQDGVLRVVQGSKLVLEIPLGSPVTALANLFFDVPGVLRTVRDPVGVVFGLQNGRFGVVRINKQEALETAWQVSWAINDESKSPVTAIKVADLSRDRGTDLVVGREDGRVEVWSTGEGAGEGGNFATPSLVFSYDLGESVCGIDVGFVNSTDYQEIVCACYSGRVVSFTSEPVMKRAQDDTYGRSVQKVNDENRIKHLRKELETLKGRVDKERDKLKKVSARAVDEALGSAHDFSVNARFGLDADHAAYVLSLELQTPLDLVVIRSPVRLEILELETNNVSAYVTPREDSDDPLSKFVAVCRCQSGVERRMTLALRTTEGEHGEMFVTVVNSASPKAAKVLRYALKPLSLQLRLFTPSPEELSRPRSSVQFRGNVGVPLLREWLLSLFFDLPPKGDEDETDASYLFKNVFTGAVTSASYRANELRFESESASTIAIIKECIGQLATSRRVQLQETLSGDAQNDLAVHSLLRLLRPKIEAQLSLLYKVEIMEACQEICMEEAGAAGGDGSSTRAPLWLDRGYADILENKDHIRADFKLRAKSLEHLSGIVTDLFVDWSKLQGVDSRHLISTLTNVIMSPNASFDDIVKLFAPVNARQQPQLSRSLSGRG